MDFAAIRAKAVSLTSTLARPLCLTPLPPPLLPPTGTSRLGSPYTATETKSALPLYILDECSATLAQASLGSSSSSSTASAFETDSSLECSHSGGQGCPLLRSRRGACSSDKELSSERVRRLIEHVFFFRSSFPRDSESRYNLLHPHPHPHPRGLRSHQNQLGDAHRSPSPSPRRRSNPLRWLPRRHFRPVRLRSRAPLDPNCRPLSPLLHPDPTALTHRQRRIRPPPCPSCTGSSTHQTCHPSSPLPPSHSSSPLPPVPLRNLPHSRTAPT
jgi:hypothetical protein